MNRVTFILTELGRITHDYIWEDGRYFRVELKTGKRELWSAHGKTWASTDYKPLELARAA